MPAAADAPLCNRTHTISPVHPTAAQSKHRATLAAAALGRGAEVAADLLDRANSKNEAFPGGWPGFASHMQDYEPSLDHWAWSRVALHMMLLQPLDDEEQRMALFPAWVPDMWDVSFKLRGPGNTVVQARCTGGKVEDLSVSPSYRAKDVVVQGCGGGGRTAEEIVRGA